MHVDRKTNVTCRHDHYNTVLTYTGNGVVVKFDWIFSQTFSSKILFHCLLSALCCRHVTIQLFSPDYNPNKLPELCLLICHTQQLI